MVKVMERVVINFVTVGDSSWFVIVEQGYLQRSYLYYGRGMVHLVERLESGVC